MIAYKCRTCRTRLETEDALGGQSEPCPACGTANPVPAAKAKPVPPAKAKPDPLVALTAVAKALKSHTPAKMLTPAPLFALAPFGSTYGNVVCSNPNCAYRGPAAMIPKGSLLLGILLLIVIFPLGLIYLVLNSGTNYICPKCRAAIGRG